MDIQPSVPATRTGVPIPVRWIGHTVRRRKHPRARWPLVVPALLTRKVTRNARACGCDMPDGSTACGSRVECDLRDGTKQMDAGFTAARGTRHAARADGASPGALAAAASVALPAATLGVAAHVLRREGGFTMRSAAIGAVAGASIAALARWWPEGSAQPRSAGRLAQTAAFGAGVGAVSLAAAAAALLPPLAPVSARAAALEFAMIGLLLGGAAGGAVGYRR